MKTLKRNTKIRRISRPRGRPSEGKAAMLCVRITEEMHEQLKAEAKRSKATLSDFVTAILAGDLRRREAERQRLDSQIPDAYKVKPWTW